MTRIAVPRVLPLAHLAAAALLLACQAANAQTPAKPAAKPAPAPAAAPADAKTLTLGGGSGKTTGKLMTRDELRACLRQQDDLARRRTAVEAERGPIDQDKDALVKEQESLKLERENIDTLRKSVGDFNARYKAYGERVEKYNERARAAQDLSGLNAERERKALDNERADLQKLQTSLEAERAKMGDGVQQAVNSFNTKATALDQRVADWNQRNAGLTQRAQALNSERETWLNDCADRRYREDDEIAIKRGQ
jgi:chromosome segregation ATPase